MSIGAAAKHFGVSVSTLRRWEREGRLLPAERTAGGQRRYALRRSTSAGVGQVEPRSTIAYARVSSHDQKNDLERQKKMLELFCAGRGWTYEVVSDLGSGLNYHKRGLKLLIGRILSGDVERLVLTHKDRLLRFGAELVFGICEHYGVEVVLMNRGEETSFEQDLAQDVLEIITVFSARLYGARSRKNRKLMESLQAVVAG